MNREIRIPSANIKRTATTQGRHAKCNLCFESTTQHHVCGSELICSSGKTYKICGSCQQTHGTEETQLCGVKTEHTSSAPACKTTSTARHRKIRTIIEFRINICPCLQRSTPTLEFQTHLGMSMPRAKKVKKNHGALFRINPFVWPRNCTHTKSTTYPKFQTHERK